MSSKEVKLVFLVLWPADHFTTHDGHVNVTCVSRSVASKSFHIVVFQKYVTVN